MFGTRVKIFRFKLLLLALVIFPAVASTQSSQEVKEMFAQAEAYYLFGDYESANPLYLSIAAFIPDNYNVIYKIGDCYLNIPDEKSKAIEFLEKAVKNSSYDSNSDQLKEKRAPLDAYFSLAKAYMIQNNLEKAIETLQTFQKLVGETKKKGGMKNAEFINQQLLACNNAIKLEATPVEISKTKLPPDFSNGSFNVDPVISFDGNTIAYTEQRGVSNAIFFSKKERGKWQPPVEITMQINAGEDCSTSSLNNNGTELFLYKKDNEDGNIYSTTYVNGAWTPIKKLNKNINTKYWEAFGFITPDGKQLYFSSNRPGGFGELDIWISQREENGNWGPAVNLGNTINTPFNENTPFFVSATGTLLFSSLGHDGMGGYDVFTSTLKNGKWTQPISMPYPVNTTSDNTLFIEDPEQKGYITSMVDDRTRVRNIYRIVQLDLPSATIGTKGSVGLQDGMNIVPGLAEIKLSQADSSQAWKKIEINDSGSYKFITKPGDYIVQIKYPGYRTDTFKLSIPKTFTGKSLSVSTSMVPDEVYSGDFLAIRSILFDFDSQSLNEQAKIDLEKLKPILKDHPELKIEITGHTDIIGSKDYNLVLADGRAQAVINYLTASGITGSRFIKKAVGATNFVAINTNPDGSDNPEGRRYNRRVTIGIINPQTGITLLQESYTPKGLRQPYSMRYDIVLMKSPEKYYPDYFSDFRLNEIFFVHPVYKDSVYLYILGEFTDKSDAESYLKFAGEKGFKEAYIVIQYEIQEQPRQLINQPEVGRRSGVGKIYIIQLSASRTPLNINQFKVQEKVKEIKGNDGYYRYVFGEFEGFLKAKTALDDIQKAGYKDAFIKEYNQLIRQ